MLVRECSFVTALGPIDLPALARLLGDTATAQSGDTGHQAVVAAALASATLFRSTLLVLHWLLGAWVALLRVVLLVALRGAAVVAALVGRVLLIALKSC